MAYKSLDEFIVALERAGELKRISNYVNPKLEIGEITSRVSKQIGGGKALLFENTGYEFPILTNVYSNERRVSMSLGFQKFSDINKEIEELTKLFSSLKEGLKDKLKLLAKLVQFSSWMPATKAGKGECQEVIMKDADLTKLPALTIWPKDGGTFITLPIVHTKDPNSGQKEIGIHKIQNLSPKLLGLYWDKRHGSAKHYREYKKLNKPMPVAIAIGGDPVYSYSASAPLPGDIDTYFFAGFLRKRKVDMVKCITHPELEVPADADFIIEGYVNPGEELIQVGPYAANNGFYSSAEACPRIHVTMITHKRNAVYPAMIESFPPNEESWFRRTTEKIFFTPVKKVLSPELMEMDMTVGGISNDLVLAKIKKEYAGQGQKVMNALWGSEQTMFTKILLLCSPVTLENKNSDANVLTDYEETAKQIFKNLNPVTDFHFSMGALEATEFSCSKQGFGGKMCIDGTLKLEEEIDKNYDPVTPGFQIDNYELFDTLLFNKFPGIKKVNSSLLKKEIPCLVIAVQKNREGQIRELHELLSHLTEMNGIKMILYLDETVNIMDLHVALWQFCYAVDPVRDHFLSIRKGTGNSYSSCIGFDGTKKTMEFDSYERKWPDLVAADDETIQSVDSKWEQLGIGTFVSSPSLKWKNNN